MAFKSALERKKVFAMIKAKSGERISPIAQTQGPPANGLPQSPLQPMMTPPMPPPMKGTVGGQMAVGSGQGSVASGQKGVGNLQMAVGGKSKKLGGGPFGGKSKKI